MRGWDINFTKGEEPKMTREEARKIVFDKCKILEGREARCLVEALEALGLIKFDEAIKPSLNEIIYNARVLARDTQKQDQSEFIAILNTAGYEIVKKS